MVEILGVLWRVSTLACFVVFVAVIVTIIDAKKRPEPVLLPSVLLWVLGSVMGGTLWVLGISTLFGLGTGHSGGRGIAGIIESLVLQAGPLLYIWTGYQIVGAARQPGQAP